MKHIELNVAKKMNKSRNMKKRIAVVGSWPKNTK